MQALFSSHRLALHNCLVRARRGRFLLYKRNEQKDINYQDFSFFDVLCVNGSVVDRLQG